MLIEVLLAFILGMLVQRIYLARCKTLMKYDGVSWTWSNNRLYKILHRINCEFCPRRHYCEKYEEVVKK